MSKKDYYVVGSRRSTSSGGKREIFQTLTLDGVSVKSMDQGVFDGAVKRASEKLRQVVKESDRRKTA